LSRKPLISTSNEFVGGVVIVVGVALGKKFQHQNTSCCCTEFSPTRRQN